MTGPVLTVDDRQLRVLMRRLDKAGADGTIPLKQLDRVVRTEMGVQWGNARAQGGGTVRGEQWDSMKPQYMRKDGTVVPAWGGVAKVRGRGKVKGRKRPSGQRVTPSSVIGVDRTSGGLRNAIVKSPPVIVRELRRTTLFIGANLPSYGERILGYDNRNILRWTRGDLVKYRRIAVAYLRDVVRKRGPAR